MTRPPRINAPHPQAEPVPCRYHPDRRSVAATKPGGVWMNLCSECFAKYNPSGIKPKERSAVKKTAALALIAFALLAQPDRRCATHDITHGPRPTQCDIGNPTDGPGDLGPNGDGWQPSA